MYWESDELPLRPRLSPTGWRALHRVAAETLDPRSALVHRALAADRPDPELAAALEEAAVDGRAPDAEIDVPTRQLLVWAADLSGDRGERERRLLLAAMHAVYGAESGDDDLWTRVEALPPSPLRYCALAGRALHEDRLAAAVYHLRAARRALAGAGPGVAGARGVIDSQGARGATGARAAGGWDAAYAQSEASAVIETVEAAVACRTARGGLAVDAAAKALRAETRDAVRLATARRLLLVGRAYTDGPSAVLRALGDEDVADNLERPDVSDGLAGVDTADILDALGNAEDYNAEDLADLSGADVLDSGPGGTASALSSSPALSASPASSGSASSAAFSASSASAMSAARSLPRDAGLLLLRGECRVLAGDLEGGARDLADAARRHGTHSGQPDRLRALEWLAITHFLRGSWQEADSHVDGIDAFTGDTAGQALRAMLATVRGGAAAPRGTRWAPAYRRTSGSAHPDRLVTAAYADVVAMLSSRRHRDILTTINWLTSEAAGLEDAPVKLAPLWLPVYVEAAVEAGTRAASEQGLARLRALAQQVPSLAIVAHRLAARLAERRHDLIAAEREYEAGLLAAETHEQVPPLHRAQLKSAYGRLLCVLGRTSAGLGWMQRAEDDFAALGALAFVRNCAQDRAGVMRAIPHGPEVALTEREVTVAGLVATGLTNRQVAAELTISAKAVEYHLRKIYRKLGVSTRSELASRWPG